MHMYINFCRISTAMFVALCLLVHYLSAGCSSRGQGWCTKPGLKVLQGALVRMASQCKLTTHAARRHTTELRSSNASRPAGAPSSAAALQQLSSAAACSCKPASQGQEPSLVTPHPCRPLVLCAACDTSVSQQDHC